MTENQQKTELAEQLEEYKKEELVWQKKESKRTVLLSAIGLLISLICGTVISVHIIRTGMQTKAEDTALYFFLLSGGFSIFHDAEKLALLRRLAERRGLIVLTDSDGAGFVIRNYLKGAIPNEQLKQAYIPDMAGKEHRKRVPEKST